MSGPESPLIRSVISRFLRGKTSPDAGMEDRAAEMTSASRVAPRMMYGISAEFVPLGLAVVRLAKTSVSLVAGTMIRRRPRERLARLTLRPPRHLVRPLRSSGGGFPHVRADTGPP